MANSLTGSPWVIDTAAVITTDTVRVGKIRWIGGTTAGHTVTVKDNDARVIWASVVAAANAAQSDLFQAMPPGFNARGFNVTSIQSGTLYVELL